MKLLILELSYLSYTGMIYLRNESFIWKQNKTTTKTKSFKAVIPDLKHSWAAIRYRILFVISETFVPHFWGWSTSIHDCCQMSLYFPCGFMTFTAAAWHYIVDLPDDDVMTWNCLRITVPLWGESIVHTWIPLTKDQIYGPVSKIHGTNMGPTRVLSAPNGPHVGFINLAVMGVLAFSML